MIIMKNKEKLPQGFTKEELIKLAKTEIKEWQEFLKKLIKK